MMSVSPGFTDDSTGFSDTQRAQERGSFPAHGIEGLRAILAAPPVFDRGP